MSIRKQYDTDLESLKNSLTEMGRNSADAVENALEALCVADADAAAAIVKGDARINNMERDIEHRCMTLLLRQQPVAGDLRRISTAMKVVTDIERIGDHAADIAEIIPHLVTVRKEGDPAVSQAIVMGKKAHQMILDALDALTAEDENAARRVIAADDEVDYDFNAIKHQLAQEIEEKERIDNMRQEFIVNVSHELKTPIALIQGYAEGLTAGVADDPEDRKFYCDTIADEADHMNKLVMQLLSLSRLELGAEQTFDEDIDLHALCAEAVRKTAVLCENRGLTVEYENAHITVRTDGDLLDQVLMNYLSNAIRYTPEGKHIEISAAKTGNSVRLSVFNEGDGLPEEELPKIWEKFYRTDRARTREAGGTGIGLSLVRAIADTLHGACGAENVEGGICFWFELPDLLPAEDSKIKD